MLPGIPLGDFTLVVSSQDHELGPDNAENVGTAIDVAMNVGCGVLIVGVQKSGRLDPSLLEEADVLGESLLHRQLVGEEVSLEEEIDWADELLPGLNQYLSV